MSHTPQKSITSKSHAQSVATRPDVARLLELYRPYLRELACAKMPTWLRCRLDPSDLVQETLLRGFSREDQFAGSTEQEYRGWLRGILEHLIVDAARFHTRARRSTGREEHLRDAFVGQGSSPSAIFRQTEVQARVEQALLQLSDDHQRIIRMRQEQGLTFGEIGHQLGKTADAVRMLWGRAILHLGKLLKADTDESSRTNG